MNHQDRSVFWCALLALLFTSGLTFYAMYSLKPPRALPKDALKKVIDQELLAPV